MNFSKHTSLHYYIQKKKYCSITYKEIKHVVWFRWRSQRKNVSSLSFGASIDSALGCQLIVCLSVLIFQSEISITQYWYSIVKYPLCLLAWVCGCLLYSRGYCSVVHTLFGKYWPDPVIILWCLDTVQGVSEWVGRMDTPSVEEKDVTHNVPVSSPK